MSRRGRVAVIGLDCATPQLLFEEFAGEMPHLAQLLARAQWGPLRSTDPPITVPAWSCMMSGRSPGELGIYGFRNRADHGYERLSVATSEHVRVPRLWDLLDAAGRRQRACSGCPAPTRHLRCGEPSSATSSARRRRPGGLIRRPSVTSSGTWWASYVLDVADFRTEDKARVAQQVFDMTEQRFRVARHLVTTRGWDLFAMVDMGPDRLHHGFWALCEKDHPRYDPSGRVRLALPRLLPRARPHLGALLEVLPDDTATSLGERPRGAADGRWVLHQRVARPDGHARADRRAGRQDADRSGADRLVGGPRHGPTGVTTRGSS